MKLFIDTEIWIFAQKIPLKSKFQTATEYKKYYTLHEKAKEFLIQKISNDEICMTFHQLCEIFHSLAFRGKRFSKEKAKKYCSLLIKSDFIYWYPIELKDIINATQLSSESNIHIWDYLCIIPIYKAVDVIFTCDQHFQHSSFQNMGPPVKNPIGEWITL